MNDSYSQKVAHSRKIRSLSDKFIVPKSAWDPYYQHFTIRINTLSEFIDIIGRLSEIAKTSLYGKLTFRGHSDASSNYKLIPVIGRKPHIIEFSENNMVTEMLTLRPEEFEGIKTDFDLLSKLQHFGLPTRILDFTYNPLIALYFACCSEKRTDSRVICTPDTSDTSTMSMVERICGLYRYSDYNSTSLDQIIGGVSQLRRYAQYTRYALMAKPKYSNDRIKHQSAVFMVFPNAICDFRSRMVVLGRENENEEKYRFHFTISEEEKRRLEYIRKEPNIYEGYYYVTSESIGKLLDYYEEEYDDFINKTSSDVSESYSFIFRNRFSIVNEIQELSDDIISNSFISILIESKNRKKIIQDLATIGIDKAFVFPELEYTAETVKNNYF